MVASLYALCTVKELFNSSSFWMPPNVVLCSSELHVFTFNRREGTIHSDP